MAETTIQPDAAAVDEVALVAALRAGDAAAYETLVRRHGGRMLAVTRRLLNNEQDAQDAVQDAFLSAFKAMDRFDAKSQLGSWLHRIAVNAALTKLRGRQRKPERFIEDLLPRFQEDGHHAEPAAPWRETGETVMQRGELRDLVRKSIDQLPDGFREVLLLRDIEELDTEETARLMGLNVSAVKTRLHRARQALRSLLDPHLREQPA